MKWKALDELKMSCPVVQAMGISNNVRHLNVNVIVQKKQHDEADLNRVWWHSLLRGSARKTNCTRKRNRFTASQKKLMEECFDAGEKNKRKRYTKQSCQQLMKEMLGEELTLTTRQIAS